MASILLLLFFDELLPFFVIFLIFGLGGLIVLRIIQFIRDLVFSRRIPMDSKALFQRFQEYEQQYERLKKRVQQLETALLEKEALSERDTGKEKDKSTLPDDAEPGHSRSLKNKLR